MIIGKQILYIEIMIDSHSQRHIGWVEFFKSIEATFSSFAKRVWICNKIYNKSRTVELVKQFSWFWNSFSISATFFPLKCNFLHKKIKMASRWFYKLIYLRLLTIIICSYCYYYLLFFIVIFCSYLLLLSLLLIIIIIITIIVIIINIIVLIIISYYYYCHCHC